jgi:hypothetical protein
MTVVPNSLAYATRAAHDIGLALWLGGATFGKVAHNPALRNIADHAERGKVANAAWNSYNVVNTAGLGAAALGWGAARVTETQPQRMSDRERELSKAKDVLVGIAVTSGVANGALGAKLAKSAPDGAVPVETGTQPAPQTPPSAAGVQRALGVLGTLNIAAGVALVAVNAVLAQENYSRPTARRALTRRSNGGSGGVTPLLVPAGLAGALAAVDQMRRATSR